MHRETCLDTFWQSSGLTIYWIASESATRDIQLITNAACPDSAVCTVHFTPTCLKTRQAALKCLHVSDWHSLHTIKLPTHTNQWLFPGIISKRMAQTSQGSLTIISSTMDVISSAHIPFCIAMCFLCRFFWACSRDYIPPLARTEGWP